MVSRNYSILAHLRPFEKGGGSIPSPSDSFEHELWGTRLNFQFTTIKLLDYLAHQPELEQSGNPFAVVVLAQLHAKKTKNRLEDRYRVKLHLIRGLYQRGFSRQQVVDLFRFIDWVLHLPAGADHRLWTEIVDFEENKKMPYITSVERIGVERGRQEGRLEGRLEGRQEGAVNFFLSLLTRRFGVLSSDQQEQVMAADEQMLAVWGDRILTATTLEELFGPDLSGMH